MIKYKIISGTLFVICVIGWILLFNLMLVLPKKVAAWEEAELALPAPTVFLVNLGQVVQNFGIVLVPLLGLITIGTMVWFVTAGREGK